MPRKMRLFVPGAIYHVYCRITRGEMTLANDNEAGNLFSEIQRAKERDNLIIFAWCILGNHYHVAMRTEAVPLWRTMASIQGRMSRQHNRRKRIRGPLWQNRYKAKIVDSQEYFNQLLAYIHLNPVAAGIVDDPAAYRWSGHGELIGLRKEELVDVDETLYSYAERRGDARRGYLEYIRSCAEERWISDGTRYLPWWRGVKDDYETVTPSFGNRYVDYKGNPVEIDRPYLPLSRLLLLFCRYTGFSEQELASRSTRRSVANAHVLFVALAVLRYRHRVKEVAKALNKNPGSVSRWLARESLESLDLGELDAIDRFVICN